MKTKHSDLVEKLTVRVNAEVVSAIQKSGQSAPDWLRQAARNRIDGERQAETPTGKLEKQVAALQQRIDDLKQDGIHLRNEIAKLQQSESIVQAALLDMRKNHVELRRSLEQMNVGFGHAFTTLGQSLLVALSQQLDRYAQKLAAKEDETPPFVLPPIPPRTRL
jgi:septation ring formation regulator EzrA